MWKRGTPWTLPSRKVFFNIIVLNFYSTSSQDTKYLVWPVCPANEAKEKTASLQAQLKANRHFPFFNQDYVGLDSLIILLFHYFLPKASIQSSAFVCCEIIFNRSILGISSCFYHVLFSQEQLILILVSHTIQFLFWPHHSQHWLLQLA